MKKKPADPLRQELAQCTSKIVAYRNVGKIADAKIWARTLVNVLEREGLLNPPLAGGG